MNLAASSGNLDVIHTATKVYFNAPVVDQVLFAVVIVWEALAVVLCWRAAGSVASYRRGAPPDPGPPYWR